VSNIDDDIQDETPEDMRERRRLADENKTTKDLLAKQAKEILFLKAGIDPDTKLGGLLLKTFEGSDPEALKAEATELGYFTKGTEPPAARFDPLEASQQLLRQSISGGNAPTGETERLPEGEAALAAFYRQIESGVPREQAAQDVAARLLGAGWGGDKSLHFDAEAHRRAAAQLEGARGR
jgi:hypothetical protein